MTVTLLRNPPADASGGFMSVRYSQAGRIIKIARFHLSGTLGGGGSLIGAGGTEPDVAATFAALVNQLQALWDNTWLIELTALTQRTGGGLVRVAVPTGVGGVYLGHAGTSGTATTGIEGYVQQNLMFSTVGNRKSRVQLIGQGGVDVGADGPLAANAAGTNLEKLAAYLTGAATNIVAHDGTKLTTPIHQTTDVTARPRRLAMRVA